MKVIKKHLNTGGGYNKQIIIITVTVFVIIISALKYRSGEINYKCSDATWHTLLTIEAYNETPITQHLFLPIVSLGNENDKNISWGATIPDEKGNYYYTSFSPAGYFAPWLFMKIFNLPVCEKSLYAFNTVLFAISAVLWTLFIIQIYSKLPNKYFLAVAGVVTYVLTPELLHGMGIVYWHQSIMQVTLLAQVMAFYNLKETNSKTARIAFYILALINPYIEWTGYVANVGFAFAEIIIAYKRNIKRGVINAIILGLITVSSFGLFTIHYLLRVDAKIFMATLKSRFMARNIANSAHLIDLFSGYLKSFLYIWVLMIVLIIWNIAQKQSIELKKGILMFLLLFFLIENILMKEHAISYTYDRMKAGFLLSLLVCELSRQLIETCKRKTYVMAIIMSLAVIAGVLNLKAYMTDETYIWQADYRNENLMLAEYINENYNDSVIGIENVSVRGYINLIFGRGIYEWVDKEIIKNIAYEKGKRFAVLIDVENAMSWNMYDLAGAMVYDTLTGEIRKIVETDNGFEDIVYDGADEY